MSGLTGEIWIQPIYKHCSAAKSCNLSISLKSNHSNTWALLSLHALYSHSGTQANSLKAKFDTWIISNYPIPWQWLISALIQAKLMSGSSMPYCSSGFGLMTTLARRFLSTVHPHYWTQYHLWKYECKVHGYPHSHSRYLQAISHNLHTSLD